MAQLGLRTCFGWLAFLLLAQGAAADFVFTAVYASATCEGPTLTLQGSLSGCVHIDIEGTPIYLRLNCTDEADGVAQLYVDDKCTLAIPDESAPIPFSPTCAAYPTIPNTFATSSCTKGNYVPGNFPPAPYARETLYDPIGDGSCDTSADPEGEVIFTGIDQCITGVDATGTQQSIKSTCNDTFVTMTAYSGTDCTGAALSVGYSDPYGAKEACTGGVIGTCVHVAPASDDSNNNAAVAGAVVGTLGGCALAAGAFFYLRRWRSLPPSGESELLGRSMLGEGKASTGMPGPRYQDA